MKRSYRALLTIGVIYKVLGVIVGIITLLSIVGFCISTLSGATTLAGMGHQMGIPRVYAILVAAAASAVLLIYGVALTLTFYAFGEGLQLLVSVAKDTREALTILKEPEQGGAEEAKTAEE